MSHRFVRLDKVTTESHGGPWERLTDDETGVPHLIPQFGPRHFFAPACWCHPVETPDGEVIVHNVAH